MFVADFEELKSGRYDNPTPGFRAPKQGFSLDQGGNEANRYNVESFPSIVAISENNNRVYVIDENSKVVNPLMKFYRSTR